MALWPNGSRDIPYVTYEYGVRDSAYAKGYHAGIDLIDFYPVCSPVSGTVIMASYNGTAGNEVRVAGDDGNHHRMLHNSSFLVSNGQRVSEGQPVAVMGATGQVTGKHTHYEIWIGGVYRNDTSPRGYMASALTPAANISAGQRTAGPDGVKRRAQPNTSSESLDNPLSAGEVGNFDGWIHGENVSGNDVWYRGTSGNWFWSGGFVEGANGTGLADLNPAQIAGNQRKTGSAGSKRRAQPTTQSESLDNPLSAGDIGTFDGWIHGESVDGNDVWFRGTSGNWFWSGGFEDTGTHDLQDLNPKTPTLQPNQRQVLPDDNVKRRTEASSQSAIAGEPLAAGAVATFNGWTKGESVSGNNVWFRENGSNNWFWSGGFVGGSSTSGLTEITTTTPPTTSTAERVVGSTSLNARSGPGTSFSVTGSAPAGSKITVSAWTSGESVENVSIWYKSDDNKWYWAGGFTSQSVDGISKVDAPKPPVSGLDTSYKNFPADTTLAKWIGSPNYNYRSPRPSGTNPTHITMHWMDGTLAGTDAQFQKYSEIIDGRGDGSAATYGVGQSEIHQYVREQDYQQADGNADSNRWGLSIEHEASASSPATESVMINSANLLVNRALKYGWKKFQQGDRTWSFAQVQSFAAANPTICLVFPHNKWVATQCPGTLDIGRILDKANAILALTNGGTPTDPGTGTNPPTKEELRAAWEIFKNTMDSYLT